MEMTISGTYKGKAVTIRTIGKRGSFDAVGDGFRAMNEEVRFGKLLRLQVPVTMSEQEAIMEMCAADVAATVAATPTKPQATHGIPARYAGTCAKSGRRYGRGAMIEHTVYGWALVGADLDLTYNMDRADSPL